MAIQPNAIPSKPPVVKWYTAYCIVMAVLYLLTAIMGAFFLISPGFLPLDEEELITLGIMGVIYIILGAVFLIPYAIAPFLPPKPWVWIYGIVLIAIGMTTICCLPATIPLLIYWIKPDVKAYFSREVPNQPSTAGLYQ